MSMRALPEESYRFRSRLLDALDRFTPAARFFYIDADTCVVVCPVCDGPLSVRFAGHAPRAELACHRGCAESEIVATLRRVAA